MDFKGEELILTCLNVLDYNLKLKFGAFPFAIDFYLVSNSLLNSLLHEIQIEIT